MDLLTYHKPTYWFSGHFHVKFAAVYYHHAQAPPPGPPEATPTPLMSIGLKEGSGEGVTDKDEKEVADKDEKGVIDEKDEGVVAEGSEVVAPQDDGGVVEQGDKDASAQGNEAPQNSSVKDIEGVAVEGMAPQEGESVVKESATADDSAAAAVEGGVSSTTAPEADMGVAMEGEGEASAEQPLKYTKFLALDKPLPKKRFLQVNMCVCVCVHVYMCVCVYLCVIWDHSLVYYCLTTFLDPWCDSKWALWVRDPLPTGVWQRVAGCLEVNWAIDEVH